MNPVNNLPNLFLYDLFEIINSVDPNSGVHMAAMTIVRWEKIKHVQRWDWPLVVPSGSKTYGGGG
jgi:hypothetical protein